jgi:HSP20 family protein
VAECGVHRRQWGYTRFVRPISRLLVSTDVGDLGPEVRRLFEELARRRPERRHVVSGECLPLQDVYETERTIELVLDVPGVTPDTVRILIKAGVVLVVGEKDRPEPARGPASFHLVERDFGRFARAVRVHAAIDAANTHARLKDGELRIVLPKMNERRGRDINIVIEADPESVPAQG